MRLSKQIRERLARLASNPAELAKALPVVCRASHEAPVLALRAADGGALSKDKRDELLAKAVAGEFVELELDVHAFDQKKGEQNRNFVRFRDGAMTTLGRTGKGTPLLRDHRQGDSLAVAGRITASKTEKLAEGEYVIQQTVRLTAPWAVELALRDLVGAVSIGWNPTGPVLCSDCNAPILTKCWHFPGDRLRVGEDGKKRFADDGDIVVEWIFTEAELIETSIVPIGAVRTARIDEIRASLSAHVPDLAPMLAAGVRFSTTDKETDMPPELLLLLGLAADATPDQVLAAVQAKLKIAESDQARLAIAQTELSTHQTAIAELQADKRQRDEDKFVKDALDVGKISVGEESNWRRLYKADSAGAVEEMGKRKSGSATPVGAPRQSATDPDKQPALSVITGGEPASRRAQGFSKTLSRQLSKAIEQVKSDPRALSFAMNAFGYEPGPGVALPTTLGPTSITNNGDLSASQVGFHAAFLQALEQNTDDPIKELYTEVPSTKPVEQWNWMGDLPGFEEWKDMRKLAGLEAFKLSITNKKWASGIRVKNDDFKDDSLGLLPAQVSGLATKAYRHRWDWMIKMLLNGFDGTAYPETGTGLGYDGAFFFSDAGHRTGDNKMTLALDAAGLTAAELLLESMTTYDGNDPMDIHGTHLIVGPKLRAQAEKLLTQERLANGEDNYHRGKYKLIVTNRLRGTYDDYWFLTDLSQPIKPFLFQMREEISTSAIMGNQGGQNDSMPRFSYDELWFGAEARYNTGYFEHRLIVGSAVA